MTSFRAMLAAFAATLVLALTDHARAQNIETGKAQCAAARGWEVSANFCSPMEGQILRDAARSGGFNFTRCIFQPGQLDSCSAVFGENYAFPHTDAAVVYYFNCDPDGETGLLPAAANTTGATECSCADPAQTSPRTSAGLVPDTNLAVYHYGACLPAAEGNCANAGWRRDGNQCRLPVNLNGTPYDFCYLSGTAAPQCADIPAIGDDFNFPAFSPAYCRQHGGVSFTDGNGVNACVTPEEKCQMTDGWQLTGDLCVYSAVNGLDTRIVNSETDERSSVCAFAARAGIPRCREWFGPNLDFPATRAGVYVFNCDPNNQRGLIPARENTVGATACACADPDGVRLGDEPHQFDGNIRIRGHCAQVSAAGQRECEDAGWRFAAGQCGIPTSLGGRDYDFCHAHVDGGTVPLSGSAVPQCAAVFGAGFSFPAFPDGRRCGDRLANDSNEGGECLSVAQCRALEKVPYDPPNAGQRQCVTRAEKCALSGWDLGPHMEFCRITPKAAEDRIVDNFDCGLDQAYIDRRSSESYLCSAAFGEDLDFPVRTDENAGARWVFNCDPDGENGMIPARENTIGATECRCPDETVMADGRCYPYLGSLDNWDEAALCETGFGGNILMADGGRVCKGMDVADTFCILDSDGERAFACRGLFKHLQRCNWEFKRGAADAFLCGRKCEDDEFAFGPGCLPGRRADAYGQTRMEFGEELERLAVAANPDMERLRLALGPGNENHGYAAATVIRIANRVTADATIPAGTPILIAAGVAGNAEAVRLILRAGANPNAAAPGNSLGGNNNFSLPFILMDNHVWGPNNDTDPRTEWPAALEVLRAFAEEARGYDWHARRGSGNNRLLDFGATRYDNGALGGDLAVTTIYEEMMEIVRAQGAAVDGLENQCSWTTGSDTLRENDALFRACLGRDPEPTPPAPGVDAGEFVGRDITRIRLGFSFPATPPERLRFEVQRRHVRTAVTTAEDCRATRADADYELDNNDAPGGWYPNGTYTPGDGRLANVGGNRWEVDPVGPTGAAGETFCYQYRMRGVSDGRAGPWSAAFPGDDNLWSGHAHFVIFNPMALGAISALALPASAPSPENPGYNIRVQMRDVNEPPGFGLSAADWRADRRELAGCNLSSPGPWRRANLGGFGRDEISNVEGIFVVWSFDANVGVQGEEDDRCYQFRMRANIGLGDPHDEDDGGWFYYPRDPATQRLEVNAERHPPSVDIQ